MSKRLGGIIGCKYKTSSWFQPEKVSRLVVCRINITKRESMEKSVPGTHLDLLLYASKKDDGQNRVYRQYPYISLDKIERTRRGFIVWEAGPVTSGSTSENLFYFALRRAYKYGPSDKSSSLLFFYT